MEYFSRLDSSKIRCELCHHHCTLKEGIKGFCSAEQNIDGKLVNITYGYPEAINLDPIEKKPLYHFLPNSRTFSLGTVGCNFRCPFCQNYSLSQKKEVNESRYLSPEIIVENALYHKCKSISYTYNEPVVFYPYARDIGLLAKENGLKNVFVTSGYESQRVCDDMKSWVDAANVDLKSFHKEYYKKSLKTDLTNVLKTLKALVKNGIWVEVTTLIIPTVNDSNEELEDIAKFIYNELGSQVPWHLSAFHPDFKVLDLPRTPIETLERAKSIADRVGLKYVYLGNVAKEYGTFCSSCKSEVVKREYFRAVEISLDGNTCSKCGEIIDGIWGVTMVRDMNFAGSFYPRSEDEVKAQFNEFNKILDANLKSTEIFNKNPKSVIVPHAGYVYSGLNANIAYRTLEKQNPKTIVVIGPSHHHYFESISLGEFDSLLTPLGDLECDKELIQTLKKDFQISMEREAHMEHSTEVQFPFIKHYFPDSKVVEIVYGHFQGEKLEEITDYLIENNYAVVISTDLSHFYTLEQAKNKDNICLNAVQEKDISMLDKGCEACGKRGVKAILHTANEKNLQSELLYYNTSADASGDKSRVVGYLSSILY